MYKGLIITKKPIDLVNDSEVSGFEIKGTGEKFFLFKTGAKWQRLDEAGELVDVDTQDLSLSSVVHEGNTEKELLSLPSIPSLAKQRVYVAIAVGAEDTPPKFKFGINTIKEEVQKTETIESEEYDVRGDIQSIEGDCSENVTIEVSGYKNGNWFPYVALDKASTTYEKVKFRVTLTVDEVGQKAVFNGVTLKAHPNDAVIPSKEVAIYTTRSVKDAKIYIVGNNKGIVKAFCSQTTPAQWKEIERLTETSFDGANGMLKITLTQDGEATPEIEGYVIQE